MDTRSTIRSRNPEMPNPTAQGSGETPTDIVVDDIQEEEVNLDDQGQPMDEARNPLLYFEWMQDSFPTNPQHVNHSEVIIEDASVKNLLGGEKSTAGDVQHLVMWLYPVPTLPYNIYKKGHPKVGLGNQQSHIRETFLGQNEGGTDQEECPPISRMCSGIRCSSG
ncbi:hypothetical protein GE061_006258 [Apolygus lucorum]|uniref:Uncharacterized protein n=1 Tax=Apolygus lucorum TaxID=248454 RepID=A0A8S9WSQ2_APOLU|nr:hypothetical protein GE061_006258 [Apolygus lucorum]